jgi:MFS family permease
VRDGTVDDERIRNEFHEMVASFEFQKRYEPGYRGIFKSPSLRKRLAYGIYATSLQQIGGIAAVTMFAVVIYKSLGWSEGSEALAINGIQSVLQLFAVLINTFTVDRFGRKPLLIVGFVIQSAVLLVLSSLTTHFSKNDNRSAGITEIAMLFIMGLTYVWSNGPIATTIATEIFPQHVRSTAVGLSLLGQTATLIALTQPWPLILEKYAGKSYWLLFSLNVFALVSLVANRTSLTSVRFLLF